MKTPLPTLKFREPLNTPIYKPPIYESGTKSTNNDVSDIFIATVVIHTSDTDEPESSKKKKVAETLGSLKSGEVSGSNNSGSSFSSSSKSSSSKAKDNQPIETQNEDVNIVGITKEAEVGLS